MVDLAADGAGDPVSGEGLPDAPGIIGELLEPLEHERLAVSADQEEPVAAPGNVAVHPPDAGGSNAMRAALR